MKITDVGYVAFELLAIAALVIKLRQYYWVERRLSVAVQAVSIAAGALFILIPRISHWVDATLGQRDVSVPLTDVCLIISTVCVQSLVRIWASGELQLRYRYLYWGAAIVMITLLLGVYSHSTQAHEGFGIKLAHGRTDILAYYGLFFTYSMITCARTARIAWQRLPDIARTAIWSARGLAAVTAAATIAIGYGATRQTALILFYTGTYHDTVLLRVGSLCLAIAETAYIIGITYPALVREWAQRRSTETAAS